MLAEQISDDLKTAMKARDKTAVAALRMALTRIKETRVSSGHGAEVTDDEVRTLIAREAKRRTEAATAFADAGRDELAAKEQAELQVLQRYLPRQLSDDEITAVIDETIAETGASSASKSNAASRSMPASRARSALGSAAARAATRATCRSGLSSPTNHIRTSVPTESASSMAAVILSPKGV